MRTSKGLIHIREVLEGMAVNNLSEACEREEGPMTTKERGEPVPAPAYLRDTAVSLVQCLREVMDPAHVAAVLGVALMGVAAEVADSGEGTDMTPWAREILAKQEPLHETVEQMFRTHKGPEEILYALGNEAASLAWSIVRACEHGEEVR